jgi:uncharacterized protein (TIGR02597 family)
MKSSFPRLQPLVAAISALTLTTALPASAQTTATTDPVGFITLKVAGTDGATSSKISFNGLGLTRPIEYQGAAETVGANTLIDNEATWTENQFNGANGKYFVEITTGAAAGTTYDVAATSAATKTITLAQNLGANVANGATFKVRKHWTISSVFGNANESGLQGGEDLSAADQILIWNGAGYNAYYYQTLPPAAGGTGWRSGTDVFADAGTAVVYPEDGLVLKRFQAQPVNVILTGAVKMGQTSIPIQSGVNIVSNVYAAPITLQSSQLYKADGSRLTAGEDATSADQVQLWNGSGYTVYYYQSLPPAAGGTGWRSGSDVFTDAGSTPIPVGTSFLVKRTNGGAFDWAVPQHPASL